MEEKTETGRTIYKGAAYAGESVSLKNERMEFILHKRLSGWGFGEIRTADGRRMGILEHLGELLVRDQELPMRLEASSYQRVEEENGDLSLVLQVASMNVQKKLDGTSFSNWMRYPFQEDCITGSVTFTLKKDLPVLTVSHDLRANQNLYVKYLRGPWLKVGEGSFGAAKDDAILPGVEWLLDTEWSSGSDWFREPWYNKFAPAPNKVAIPCMTLSKDGTAIGLAWNPVKWATRWFNYRKHFAQPVFAVPNFVERTNNSLFGLMVPSGTDERDENQIYADPPLEVHYGQMFRFESEIFLCEGNAQDAVCDWVKRHGLPALPEETDTRAGYLAAIDRIAGHYATNLWRDGAGFGNPQGGFSLRVPGFLRQYIKDCPESGTAKILKERIAWCDARAAAIAKENEAAQAAATAQAAAAAADPNEARIRQGKRLLDWQRADGSFPFEPDGRHKSKDDFTVARDFAEPMGQSGDTALSMCVSSAQELLDLAGMLPENVPERQAFLSGARRALDFCMEMTRPEGGDYWETPLHAPNLLAAGQAAVAFYEGYRAFGEEAYRRKAVYWIRSVIPFTHLWQPENIPMLYNTKPCLCSSDWYFANWVRDHVQWEVLQVFNTSCAHGIDWAKEDPEIDWNLFHRGITSAAIRWIVDHKKEKWMPHNLPATYQDYIKGAFDGCFPDTFNCTTGNYGGMVISPEPIVQNLVSILNRDF